jgi:hypothetical protein
MNTAQGNKMTSRTIPATMTAGATTNAHPLPSHNALLTVERPVLDQFQVDVGGTLEARVQPSGKERLHA